MTSSLKLASKSKLAGDLADHLNQMVSAYFSEEAPPVIAINVDTIQTQIDSHPSEKLPEDDNQIAEKKIYYLGPHEAWHKLSSSIQTLAKLMGIAKTGFSHLGSCARRIEHDYAKFRYADFLTSVSARLAQFPVSPLTRLNHIQATLSGKHERILCRELFLLLGGQPYRIAEKSYDLQTIDPTLKRYEFLLQQLAPTYSAQSHRNSSMTTAQRLKTFETIAKEQLSWNTLYTDSFAQAAPTLYSLQDANIDSALKRVLHGSAPAPEKLKAVMHRVTVTQRQRRHRKRKNASFPKKRDTVKAEVEKST